MVRHAAVALVVAGLAATIPSVHLAAQAGPVLFEHARLIPGDGSATIERSAFIVDAGLITRVGVVGAIAAPANATRVDLSGKTVMPTLIGTHGHPGFQRGLSYGADNFTRDTVMADLNRALYFGVSVVQSQGIEAGDLLYRIRADQQTGRVGGARLLVAGRGIGAPNAGPGGAAYAGIAYEVTTETEARRSVEELAARKVDLMKIWVDDRNGRAPKLSPPVYRTVIHEAHARGFRVSAHVFYHDDAVDLVEAGVDAFAHLVRDREMDAALVAAIVRKNVYVNGNLTTPKRPTHAVAPPWLTTGDPLMSLLAASIPVAVVERMRGYYAKRDPEAVAGARQRYDILQRSLAKLNAAGAKLVLGADTGLEDHVFGLAEQLELQAMVEAGMSPAQGIVAATGSGSISLSSMATRSKTSRTRDASPGCSSTAWRSIARRCWPDS